MSEAILILVTPRVCFAVVKSSLCAMLVMAATTLAGGAHEVRPAIADLLIEGQSLTLDIRLNVEAFVAGIDLAEITDTNEAAQARDYDSLRAKDPEALEADFRSFWPQMQAGLNIMVGPDRITPELTGVAIDPVGEIDLPRDARIVLTATLPATDDGVTVGWNRSFGPLVLRQTGEAEGAYTGYLTDGQSSDVIPRNGTVAESTLQAFGTYVKIGFEHILPKGLDHILFVLGLFFLSLKARPLLIQVTAFTLAHTVALALGILGYVTVPAAIVEPLIAASIVYVAVENILTKDISRWRPFVVFAFGLLHGLGFASVLGEIGLDPQRFVLGLIGFNIGVELGQLTVIALAFLAVGAWFRHKDWYRSRISNPASLVIALIGGYWFVERVWI